MRFGLRLGACVGAIVALLVGFGARAPRAGAHPLGNFTINHYDRLTVSDAGIEVYSILDMAEIPAFRERQSIDADGDGEISAAESDAYAETAARRIAERLTLRVDGREVGLEERARELTFPDGQGGLKLLRLAVTYTASLPDGWRGHPPAVEFRDDNDAGRLGWREIVVRAGAGVEVRDASVPATDVCRELTASPQDALSSPLDVRAATFSFARGAGAAPPEPPDAHATQAVRGNPDSPLARYAALVAKDRLSAGVVILALLAAMGFGAIHALSPGHGKTIVAAYLVGSRGTAKHALLLAATVTLTHTSSVYALGFVTLYLSEYVVPERLYPWLGAASGGLIVAMGLSLFATRLRASGLLAEARAWLRARLSTRPARVAGSEAGALVIAPERHAHPHDDRTAHAHDHQHPHDARPHSHGFGRAHSHAIPGQDGVPVTWRRLVGLGIFGGLLPCPSAIVVMLSAISLHRVGFGLLLIVAFSLGLALVLSGIGFALVFASRAGERLPWLRAAGARLEGGGGLVALGVRAFPTLSAAAVIAAGALVTLNAAGGL